MCQSEIGKRYLTHHWLIVFNALYSIMLALLCYLAVMEDIKRAIARDLARLADLVENENVCPDFLLFRIGAILANIGLVSAEMDTELDPLVLQNLERVAHQIGVSSNSTSRIAGRPSHPLPISVIESYLLSGLTAVDIARLFGVSERTIWRRMAHNGIR